jgi:predicted transcriptional regulator
MTDAVEALVCRLTPRRVRPDHVLREMPAGQGVVDLLAVDFDDQVLSRRVRAELGPIELPLRIQVLSHLRPDRFLSLERLARRVGSNPRALARSTLRPLAELGAIELQATRARATGAWIPVAKRLTAVELKLSKWRDAARQADNAAWAVDRSWVVLDARRAGAALRNHDYFAEFGIGLAVVDSTGVLQVVERPRRSRSVPWLRAWLGELAWARVAADSDAPSV